MLQKKTTQVFIGPVLEEGRLKSIKTIYHFIRLFMENVKIFVPFLQLQRYACHVLLFTMR